MTELNTVEVDAVIGALDIAAGIRAGVNAFHSGSDLVESVCIGISVALAN